jgi:RHS repeat-associated protein
LVATRDSAGAYRYYASDHLGTPRLVTNTQNPPQVVESHKYQPFGQEIGGVFGTQPLKFAAMERDASSGKDYDHARFLSATDGRFLIPDRIPGESEDPQTWNRYAYAKNNPLLYIDPTGEAIELIGETDEERRRALVVLQSSAGNAGSRLYINELKEGDNMRYFVGIRGSVEEFNKLSITARGLSSLIGDKHVVEFALTSHDLSREGGAATFEPGEIGNQNARVLVNPNQVAATNRSLNPASVLGATRFAGWAGDPRWRVNPFTTEINTWHELGHAWGFIHGRAMGSTNPDALRWENRMRQLLYGPLGPSNAPRVVH